MSKDGERTIKMKLRIIKTMFVNFITNEKCTNKKYRCSNGLKIITVGYIKIETISGDTALSLHELNNKVLI